MTCVQCTVAQLKSQQMSRVWQRWIKKKTPDEVISCRESWNHHMKGSIFRSPSPFEMLPLPQPVLCFPFWPFCCSCAHWKVSPWGFVRMVLIVCDMLTWLSWLTWPQTLSHQQPDQWRKLCELPTVNKFIFFSRHCSCFPHCSATSYLLESDTQWLPDVCHSYGALHPRCIMKVSQDSQFCHIVVGTQVYNKSLVSGKKDIVGKNDFLSWKDGNQIPSGRSFREEVYFMNSCRYKCTTVFFYRASISFSSTLLKCLHLYFSVFFCLSFRFFFMSSMIISRFCPWPLCEPFNAVVKGATYPAAADMVYVYLKALNSFIL